MMKVEPKLTITLSLWLVLFFSPQLYAATQTVPLHSGWNLVAPTVSDSQIISTINEQPVFYDLDGAIADASTTSYRIGSGYWIYSGEVDGSFELSGESSAVDSTQFHSGWNLIGITQEADAGEIQQLIETTTQYGVKRLYHYDSNGWHSYDFLHSRGDVTQLHPGYGYWVELENRFPVAIAKTITLDEDTQYSGTLDATDAEGGVLSFSMVDAPGRGTAVFTDTATGAFTYTPSSNENGSDQFTFKVNDGGADSNEATVTLTIQAVNDIPVAAPAAVVVSRSATLEGILSASDLDGDDLIFTVVTQPQQGTLTITDSATGAFSYTATGSATGIDPFTFKVGDGVDFSTTETVIITINENAPTATTATITLDEDSNYSGTLVASDSDGDSLTYAVVTAPEKGVVTITNEATGAFTYIPSSNENGSDSFSFKANDGSSDSATVAVAVTIDPVNDHPVATAASISLDEDVVYTGELTATDVESSALTYSVVGQTERGVVAITNEATGAFSYTPTANENGSDSFTFKVNDGAADSSEAMVNLTITAVNDLPVATDGGQTSSESAFTGTLTASDVESDSLTYVLLTEPTSGTLTITDSSTGAFSYTATAGFDQSVSFTFKVNDSVTGTDTSRDSNVATMTLLMSLSMGTSSEGVDCEVDEAGNCVAVSPTLFSYGLPIGSGAPVLLQDVEIYRVNDGTTGTSGSDWSLSENPIGQLRDPVDGLALGMLPINSTIAMVKEGYLTVYKNLGTNPSIYGVMQEVVHHSDALASDSVLGEDESIAGTLQRRLYASPAAAAPSSARNNAGAALLFGVGRGNPNSSIGIQVTPYQTMDGIESLYSLEDSAGALPTLDQDPSLEAAAMRAYRDAESLGSNNATSVDWGRKFAAFSFKVIGGAALRVYDRNTGEDYTTERRAASHSDMGGWADVRPYLSSTLEGSLDEYLALSTEFASAHRSDDYRVLNRAFMRTPSGWREISGEVKFIDPADTVGTVATTMEDYNGTDKLLLENVDWGYNAVENRTVKHKLPLNQLVMTTIGDDNGLLMEKMGSPDSSGTVTAIDGGGLYDFAFVSVQVLPVVRDLVITVKDGTTENGLSSSLVSLDSGASQLTSAEGKVTFRNVALPIIAPTITLSGLRNDHYRNSITLDVGEIISGSTLVTETIDGVEIERNQYTATLRLQQVADTASITGQITSAEDERSLEDAEVRLIAPAALSQLKADMVNSEFTAFNDPQAKYTWVIRPHYDENQPARSSRLSRTLQHGLQRILVNSGIEETWQPLKSAMGREGGYRLSFDDVLRKIANVEEGQDASDEYSLVGTYDIQLTVDYEIDQSHRPDEAGFGDYQEISTAMTIGVGINRGLFSTTGMAGRPLHRLLPYPVVPGEDEASSGDGGYADTAFELRGSAEHQYFYVINKMAGIQKIEPRVYWELDITWADTDGNVFWLEPQLTNEVVTGYQWQAQGSEEWYTADRHRTIALSPEPILMDADGNSVNDASWHMPILSWNQVISKISSPELFKALLEPIDSDDYPNGARYIDTKGNPGDSSDNSGFDLKLKAVVYADEGAYNTGLTGWQRINFNPVGDTDDDDHNIPFVYTVSMNIQAPFSQNRESVLKITDATAVASEGLMERTTQTGAAGYYTFRNIPIDLGASTNDSLTSSYLRVGASKALYYDAELTATDKFTRDNVSTSDVLEDVVTQSLILNKIPTRNVTVTTSALARVYTGEGDIYQDADENGIATFTNIPVGDYIFRAEPHSSDDDHGMVSAPLQVTQFVANTDADIESAQTVSLPLTAATWISTAVPTIDVEISELLEGGYVVIDGEVKEYRTTSGVTELVAYGVNTVDGVTTRVRDLLSIRINDRIIPLTMDDGSHFSTTVALREGQNGIIVTATNEVGTYSSSTQLVNFFPSYGSISGFLEYDHDNSADTEAVPAAGATLIVNYGATQRTLIAEEDGSFMLYGLPAGETIALQGYLSTASGDFALDGEALDVYVPEGVHNTLDETIVLTSIATAAEGAPVVAVDDSLVKNGVLYLDVRVGNYDGQGIGSATPRPIQVTINGEHYDLAVENSRATHSVDDVRAASRRLNATVTDETENRMWHVNTQSIRLTQRHNEIMVTATNLNGEQNSAPPLYLENDAIDEVDLAFTVTATSNGTISLYNIAGEPVAVHRFVVDGGAATESFYNIAEGIYTYLIEAPGYIPARGRFTLDSEANSSLTQAISLEAAQLEIAWFELESLAATRLRAQGPAADQATVAMLRAAAIANGSTDPFPEDVEAALIYIDATGRLTTTAAGNSNYYPSEALTINGTDAYTRLARVTGNLRLVIPTEDVPSENPFAALLQVNVGGEWTHVQAPTLLPTPLVDGSVEAGDDGVIAGTNEYLIPFSAVVNLNEGNNIVDIVATASDGVLRETASTIYIEPASTPAGALTVTLDWADGADMDLHSFYFPEWGVDDTSTTVAENYDHIFYADRSYIDSDGNESLVQDLDWTHLGWDDGTTFQPEHHSWATALQNGEAVVADGTYLIVANDYGSDDAARITLTLTAPGIDTVTYGPFDHSEMADSGKQPTFVVHVENHRVVDLEIIPLGEGFGTNITDMLGAGNLYGPDTRGMYRTRALVKTMR